MINNFKALSRNLLRRKALLIANAGYEAINIEKVVREKISLKNEVLCVNGQKINLNQFDRIFILGIGKGSALASLSLAKILGKKLSEGIALDVQKPKFIVHRSSFRVLVGSHPLPSIRNVEATQEIIKLAQKVEKDDLIIAFICGGGSALLCSSEKEMRNSILATKKLTEAGANIIELNTVRKHLSEVKGGGLAKLAYPATVISLIASDVLGNDLSMVASGPTVFDKTTKKDAERIWKKYQYQEVRPPQINGNVRRSNLQKLKFHESPKDKKYFKKVKNILFLSNREPISAMAKKAKQLKLKPRIYSLKLKGEAKKALVLLMRPLNKGEVILAGGETTVTLKGKNLGKGGRNQEAVLGALAETMDNERCLPAGKAGTMNSYIFLSIASDGYDNTEAAGAIGDYSTIEKAKKLKLNPKKYLENHDSFNFFKKTGDLIYTDKISFNISDLMFILSSSKG